MTTRDFCFWMMGSLELVEPEDGLNEKQTQILKNHLNMVFEHIVNEDGTLKDEHRFDGSEPMDFTPKVNC